VGRKRQQEEEEEEEKEKEKKKKKNIMYTIREHDRRPVRNET